MKNPTLLLLTAGLAACASSAFAGEGPPPAGTVVTATLTADNHYSVYGVNANGGLTFVGRNEVGPDGAPFDFETNRYNWSQPETWTFVTEDVFYVAAWSDDAIAQGLLGQFAITGFPGAPGTFTILSGGPQLEVFRTNDPRNEFSPAPDLANVQGFIDLANATNGWRTPSVGQANTPATTPWAQVPGITPNARWTWADAPNGENVFEPGFSWNEYLLFRITIPSPGGMVLAGMGLALMARRKRS